MELYLIPVQDKFIIYRPLLRLAFVGNRAMAELAAGLAKRPVLSGDGLPEEVRTFLDAVGFLQPDPPPPPPPPSPYCPSTAVLLMTNRCNLRCTYCYASGGEGPVQDLPLELAQAAIDQVCANAVEQKLPRFELTFHGGGEPVQVWEVLQAATAYARNKELPCRTAIVSNGVWTDRQREWILENIDELSISFDGRPQTQDRQRPFASGRGSSRAVMRTLQAMDKAGFSYGIRMTATAPWLENLPEDVRFICEETACPAMQVEPAFNTVRGVHQGPTEEEGAAFVEAFLVAFDIALSAGRRLSYSAARPWLLTQAFCTAPYAALVVNAAGRLVSCYEVTSETHPLAALSTIGRVEDGRVAIDHSAHRALVDHIEAHRATCRDCFCYWHCAGDCYTRTYYAQASAGTGANPRCRINREITAGMLLRYIMAGDGVWRGQDIYAQEAHLIKTF